MLPAGDHEIEFANLRSDSHAQDRARVGLQDRPAKIDLPNGVVSINAQPWAEVWIDGEGVGETPIGNLARRSAITKSCSGIPSSGSVGRP